MPVSWVNVANSALIKCGAQTIQSFSDGTVEANLTNNRYEDIRDIVLRTHPWSCAMRRVILTPLVPVPAFDFTTMFLIPADCLRVHMVFPQDTDYRREYVPGTGQVFVSDASELDLKYVAQLTDPTQVDPCLADSIACRLAHDICYSLTQAKEREDDLWKLYMDSVRYAKSINAMENPPGILDDTSWTESRSAGISTGFRTNR